MKGLARKIWLFAAIFRDSETRVSVGGRHLVVRVGSIWNKYPSPEARSAPAPDPAPNCRARAPPPPPRAKTSARARAGALPRARAGPGWDARHTSCCTRTCPSSATAHGLPSSRLPCPAVSGPQVGPPALPGTGHWRGSSFGGAGRFPVPRRRLVLLGQAFCRRRPPAGSKSAGVFSSRRLPAWRAW